MNEWWTTIGFWLVDFAVMATILLAVALALRFLLRNPGSRVLLAWGTWLGILAAAVVTTIPSWPRSNVTRLLGLRGSATQFAVTGRPQAASLVILEASPNELEAQITVHPATGDTRQAWSWPQIVAVAWTVVGGAAGVRIGVGWWHVRQILRQSTPAPSWVQEEFGRIAKLRRIAVDVRVSGRLTSVVATRVMRPAILLPQKGVAETNLIAIQAALAHEWAHIRHGDLWLLALERLLMPLLAVHPLFWWLRRSTRLDQELLADAVAAGNRPVEYAEALVTWAKETAPSYLNWTALAMSERSSNLYRRIDMILNHRRPLATRLGTLCGWAAVCCLLALLGGLSLVTLRPLAADDETAEQAAGTPRSETVTNDLPAEAAVAVEPVAPTVITATEPGVSESPVASTNEQSVITLKVTLMAHDFAGATYDKIKSVANVERIAFQMQGGERHVMKAELDEQKAVIVMEQVRAIEGVRALCSSTVFASSGQQAHIGVVERGPRVVVEQSVDGRVRRQTQPQDIHHRVTVTPRTTTDPNRLEVTVLGGWLKQEVGVGKTLMLVSTAENEIIFISPTKVELRRWPVLSEQPVFTQSRAAYPITPATPVPAMPQASPYQLLPPWPSTTQPTAPRAPQAATPPGASAPAANQAGGTQRKLLELDLAEAKLNVEAAEAELEEIQVILKKSPGSASRQDVRKRQLEVERAKIQVQRIQIQLEAASKPAEPKAQPTGTSQLSPPAAYFGR